MIVYRGTSSREVKNIKTEGLKPYCDKTLCFGQHFRSLDGIDAYETPELNVTNSELIAKLYAYMKCYGAVISEATAKAGFINVSPSPVTHSLLKGTPVLIKMDIPENDLHFYAYDDIRMKTRSYMISRQVLPEEVMSVNAIKESYIDLLKQQAKTKTVFSQQELNISIQLSMLPSINKAIKEAFEA
jgi:hypothetical protein